jgi:3',5'-cyclic AMP phosphodiesterase CpdA
LHITDTESPARLDFITDSADDPRYEQALPTLRPQQLTSTHAAAATLRTIGRMASNARLDCAVLTGDLIDNGQANELDRLIAMISGGTIAPSTVPGRVEGAQSDQWTDARVWQPARPDNYWVVNYGFPSDPDILQAVSRPIEVSALQLPVLLARGNHDALLAGSVAWTSTLSQLATSALKVRELPAEPLIELSQRCFRSDPDAFFTGGGIKVTADERRRPLAGNEFPLAFNANTDRVHGNDYLVRLGDRVAIVVLDTADLDGHPAGVCSAAQASWLEGTLTAVEATIERPVVIVASHHGPGDHHVTAPTPGRLTGPEVVALLGRYSSVALWITGHTHVATTTRHQPDGSRGFWEITAPSIIDWPNQFQTIEVLENPSGALTFVIEQHNYDATTLADIDDATVELADLHRLLSANQAGFGTIFPGAHHEVAGDSVLHLEAGRNA